MPKYIVERNMPGAASLPAEEFNAIQQKSLGALAQLGPQIQWQQCYVTDDKLYCIFNAPDAELIREHANLTGLPADRISQVVE